MKKLEDYLYYEEKDPDLKIYCGDCLEIMPLLPKVDLVVTDPPYGIGDRMGGGSWSYKEEMRVWDCEAKQNWVENILSLDVPAIIWGGNYYSVPPSRGWLIWKKPNFPSMSDAEMAFTNIDMNIKVKEFNRSEGEKLHPTQKPLPIIKWCLSFADGDVLDPFLGSGTTLVACKELNRNGIGIEINEKYCEIAKKRLRATCKPLFREEEPKAVQQDLI